MGRVEMFHPRRPDQRIVLPTLVLDPSHDATADSDNPLAPGAHLFDRGAFLEAHEAWEKVWRDESDEDERCLLQGLIQVAAAFHKLLIVGSPESASRLFARGLAKLDSSDAVTNNVAGFDLVAFREGVRACESAAVVEPFDRARIPRLSPNSVTGP